MLFYERAKPKVESTVIPKLSPTIFDQIWKENMSFLVDKNIFDKDYFTFLWDVVKLAEQSPVMENNDDNIQDPLFRSIELATRFIIITMAHAKEKPSFKNNIDHLKTLYSSHIPACRWLLRLLTKDPTLMKQIFFYCSVSETREFLARLFIHVASCVAPMERDNYNLFEEDEVQPMEIVQKDSPVNENPLMYFPAQTSKSFVIRFMDTTIGLLKEANPYWTNYAQLFLILRDFAKFGMAEVEYLHSRRIISVLIDFYLGEESPFFKFHKQKKAKMGDKFTTPNLNYMMDLLATMARSSKTNSTQIPPTQLPGKIFELSEDDKLLLYSVQFYSKSLKENINPKATAEISRHLAWEDEATSKALIEVCTNGINAVDHDGFKPYQEVIGSLLAISDSLQTTRVEYALTLYIKVVENNFRYKNATLGSIRFLVELIPQNLFIREWLFNNLDKWVEPWFMSHESDQVRDMTLTLIQALAPGYPLLNQDGTKVNVPVVVPDEVMQRVHVIYNHLLELLKSARIHWRVETEPNKSTADYDPSIWRLTNYFRLLKWYARSQKEKDMFAAHFGEFTTLFNSVEQLRYVFDENKKEMINFLLHCINDSPGNIKLLVSNEKFFPKIMDFFITINQTERCRLYNLSTLPQFYNILEICCLHSQAFLEKLMEHINFDWAVKFLFLDSFDITRTSLAILRILDICCAYPEFRAKQITKVIESKKIHTNFFVVLR